MRFPSIILILSLLLAACGTKGPLTLPKAVPSATPGTAAAPAADDNAKAGATK